jgi:choline dehydrogenase-like flavoprotein
MAKFDYNDDSVVVIVGSGAGGGTLANELCHKGVKVVVLEAGKRQSSATFINDEWKSFGQLAWTDKRTTSGNWRVAKDFPELPAWVCKTVGGTTTHWAGASLRFHDHEFKARTTYGSVDQANLLDWPITLADLEPYYARAENKMGVTRTNGISGLPGNNNFKIMYDGATKVGYKSCNTGHMAINSRPRAGRGRCMQLGSGQVGRNYMRHTTGSVFGVFKEPVHFYRGTVMAGIVTDEAGFNPKRGFAGGYELETISLGLPFAAAFFDPGAWGSGFTYYMDNYTNTAGMWIVGEDMPHESNRVTLNHDVKDQVGLPVANVHYDDYPNDIAMRNHAYKQGEAIYAAAGATKTLRTPPYPSTHNLGTCRMSAKASDGVCNKHGQTFDVPNLFISDGSQFTTSAAENPTLTIVSLAIRQSDYIADQMKRRSI